MSSGRTLRDLSAPAGVAARRRCRSARPGCWPSSASSPCSICVTTYPRRYIDRTRQADVSDSWWATRRRCWRRCSRRTPGGPGPGAPSSTLVVRDDTGRLARSSSSTSPGGPSSSRRAPRRSSSGRWPSTGAARQMANPVVDVVAGVTPGPAHAAHPARVPGLGQGRADELGDRRVRGGGARAGGRVRRPAAAPSGAPRSGCGTAPRRSRAIHAPESLRRVEPARRRLVFDELFRLQLALVLRRRAFEVNARALHHDVSPREVTGARGRHAGGALPGRPALRADQGAAPRAGRDRGRHGRALPHAPPAPGRRGLGQDRRRAGRAAWPPCRAGTRAR